MFFSDFGSLIHDILARYYAGKLPKEKAETEYLFRFPTEVRGKAPSHEIKSSYFNQGLEYVRALSPIPGKVLGVEEFVKFKVEDRKFIGFVDLVYEDEDGKLVILDHKSRALKPRSKRKKPTKTDEELDRYLRQLYLYSIPIAEKYDRPVDFLEFNCYRTGVRIKEQFHAHELDKTVSFLLQTIGNIAIDNSWSPNIDWFKCKNLCGLHEQCEYAQMISKD